MTGRERLVAAIPGDGAPGAHRAARPVRETYALWPRHLSPVRYDQLLAIFGEPEAPDRDGRRIAMTQTVLGMVAAGLTVALVDPAIKHRAVPGIVFRPIAARGVFTESGVIYRRDDQTLAGLLSLSDDRLKSKKIGTIARTPVVDGLAADGLSPHASGPAPRKRRVASRR